MEVAALPKFVKYFKKEDIQKVLDVIDCCSKIVKVKSTVNLCRDPKDNFLLALAKDSNADYLITGDEDLLVIKNIYQTDILSYIEFSKKI